MSALGIQDTHRIPTDSSELVWKRKSSSVLILAWSGSTLRSAGEKSEKESIVSGIRIPTEIVDFFFDLNGFTIKCNASDADNRAKSITKRVIEAKRIDR